MQFVAARRCPQLALVTARPRSLSPDVHASILSMWRVKIVVIYVFVALAMASIGYFNNISEYLTNLRMQV
nr:Niemann-Pick C1 protein [Ipomoea batatas]